MASLSRASFYIARLCKVRQPGISLLKPFSSDSSNSKHNESEKSSKSSRFIRLADSQVDSKNESSKGVSFVTEMNPDGLFMSNREKNRLFKLHEGDQEEWTTSKLAQHFDICEQRVHAILKLKKLELETVGVLEDNDMEEDIGRTVSSTKTKLRRNQEKKEASPLTMEENSGMPNFAFLTDDEIDIPKYAGGRNKKTFDVISYEEARKRQEQVNKSEVKELPSFSPCKPTYRWKIAIRDLSKIKNPIEIRDKDGSLRYATPDEASKRSWVKRPPAVDLL